MAQPQTQANDASMADTRRKTNLPAMQGRGSRLATQGPLAWAAGPFGLMRRLSDDMDELFDQFLSGAGSTARTGLPASAPVVLTPSVEWMPALEIFQRDGNLVVQADLPGVSADDVTVEVADGLLTVSGERREEREIDDGGLRRTERRYGKFSRSIALPEGARTEEVSASCRDGVLEITIPLAQEAPRSRKIDIQSAPQPESSGTPSASASTGSASTGANKGKSADAREAAKGGTSGSVSTGGP